MMELFIIYVIAKYVVLLQLSDIINKFFYCDIFY